MVVGEVGGLLRSGEGSTGTRCPEANSQLVISAGRDGRLRPNQRAPQIPDCREEVPVGREEAVRRAHRELAVKSTADPASFPAPGMPAAVGCDPGLEDLLPQDVPCEGAQPHGYVILRPGQGVVGDRSSMLPFSSALKEACDRRVCPPDVVIGLAEAVIIQHSPAQERPIVV